MKPFAHVDHLAGATNDSFRMQQVPQTLSYLQEKAAGPYTRGGGHEGIPSMPTPTLLSVFDERNCLLEVIHACTELE